MKHAALTGVPRKRTELTRLVNFQLAQLGCTLSPSLPGDDRFDIVTIADGRIVWIASEIHTIAVINRWLPDEVF